MPLPTHVEDRSLPAGVVTFVMTDVEGSGSLWIAHPKEMAASVRELDSRVGEIVARANGVVIKERGEGDSHFAVFTRPSQAVLAACTLQAALRDDPIAEGRLRVRIGVHTGEVDPADGDYYGVPVNQAARLRSLAHGGQTLLSRVTAFHVETTLAAQVRFKSLGYHAVRDFPRLQEVIQATLPGNEDEFPPLRTESTRGPAVMAVVIVDLCGASRLAKGRKGFDLVAEQRVWISAMRRIGEAHGSASMKILGDGCLVAFEDPAEGLAFAQSFRAAVADSGLEIRSGAEVGRVELFDGEVMGQAAFVAAELLRIAQPGQIVVTGTLRDLAGRAPDAASLGTRTLKANGCPTELYAV